MMQPPRFELTPEEIAGLLSTVKWIMGGAFAAIGAVLAFLMRLVWKFATVATKLEHVAADMLGIKENADKVPALERDVATLKDVVSRSTSDIKDLLRGPRGSQPSIHDSEE